MSKDDGEAVLLHGLMRGPDDGVPRYLRLRNALAASISAGAWKAGARIPAEGRLAAATGLSLGTVQKALRALADDGLVVRRHGSGTFISEGETPMNAPFYHCRFLDDEGKQLPIFSKFVSRHPARDDGPWRRVLPGGEIVCIERTFSINREFQIFTHLYFDARRLPALARATPAQLGGVNVKALIASRHHVALARFAETMAVRVFPDAVCAAIGVKRRTSGAVLEIAAYDRRGEAVYLQDLFIPPAPRRLFIAS
jgi:GntR family transcriptional regulator